MAIAREAEPVGSLHEVREAGLDRVDLLGIYRNMLITRGIEERGHILYRQGKIPGSFYTGRGNEAASVAIGTAMRPDDGQGRQRPYGGRAPGLDRDGQPPAGDGPRGRRLRARVPDPRGAARRD